MTATAAAALAAAVFGAGLCAAAEPEPPGYRDAPYLGSVPETLAGAAVVETAAAAALWRAGASFVDVLPRPERPADLPEGTIWRDAPHETVPGAFWLPNTGYAALAAETLTYFLAGLGAATDGDRAAPLVVFCQRDCWMSWNAAKRALEHGYEQVFWFPEGVDGWSFDDLPVARAEPWAPDKAAAP